MHRKAGIIVIPGVIWRIGMSFLLLPGRTGLAKNTGRDFWKLFIKFVL